MTNPSLPYVVPFIAFFVFLTAEGRFGFSPAWEYPLRIILLSAILWIFSRQVLSFRISSLAASLAVGIAVFALWIAPDLIIPGYRHHWLFNNAIVGSPPAPGGGYGTLGMVALASRVLRAVILVPIIEELFWRAWLMRWLIKPDFESVPLGAYSAQAFAVTAFLFAAEHGSFWGVGLLAGIIFNWWMIRTKSLGDCILAHAVANACLCAYVLAAGKWEYL